MNTRHMLRGAAVATVAIASLLALPARGSAATSSKNLLACQKRIESQLRAFTGFLVVQMTNCSRKVLDCKLANEIDAVDPTSCLAAATSSCGAIPAKASSQQSTRANNVISHCGLIPLADLEAYVAGLGFFNVVSGCGASSVTDLVNCIVADARCDTERAVFRDDPRAQDSFTSVGVAASFPCAAP